jgi:hypothetical protein
MQTTDPIGDDVDDVCAKAERLRWQAVEGLIGHRRRLEEAREFLNDMLSTIERRTRRPEPMPLFERMQ